MTDMQPSRPVFGPDGLVPAIAQDRRDGTVLTLAYMNQEAWDRTLATGRATFWSRSRQRLWEKGETSGNRLLVRAVRLDCDADAVLLLVDATGPACHTGERSCFLTTIRGEEFLLRAGRHGAEPG